MAAFLAIWTAVCRRQRVGWDDQCGCAIAHLVSTVPVKGTYTVATIRWRFEYAPTRF